MPDGGGVTPTRANLTGLLVAVGAGSITVRLLSGGRPVRVHYDDKSEFYGAFGGDYPPSDFAVGQRIWVWCRGCKPPSKEADPVGAYLQLFSRDPLDQP